VQLCWMLCKQAPATRTARMPRYSFSGCFYSWTAWRNCTCWRHRWSISTMHWYVCILNGIDWTTASVLSYVIYRYLHSQVCYIPKSNAEEPFDIIISVVLVTLESQCSLVKVCWVISLIGIKKDNPATQKVCHTHPSGSRGELAEQMYVQSGH